MASRKLVSFFGSQTEDFVKLNLEAQKYAEEKGIDFVWVPQDPFSGDSVVEHLNHADAGLIDVEPYDDAIFSRMNERCKLLIRFGVGFDQVDLEAASRHGLAVTRTTGANKTAVAEMALVHILAARRQLFINRKVMESGVWEKNLGHELLGKRVGILGFGNVGIALAKILRGFDCEVVAYDARRHADAAKECGVSFAEIDEIFETCDAISVHLPYNAQTHNCVDARRLAMMKKDAVISCTARGGLIDEDALYEVLKERIIAGAALDVFAEEPLPADSKLLQLDNLILTPHVASQTYESLWSIYEKAIDIMADFFAGKPLGRGDLLNPDYIKHQR